MPKLAKPFYVVAPGSVFPQTLPVGAEVSGALAAAAASRGLLEVEAPAAPAGGRKAARRAPENQAHARAPETK